MSNILHPEEIAKAIKKLDDKLSQRFIALDPKGYFLIKVNQVSKEIILEHYSNEIDSQGRAINPETGKPIGCRENTKQKPSKIFIGKSAKQLGIQVSEGSNSYPLSTIDHAIYLGRELQKAEECLKGGIPYVQD